MTSSSINNNYRLIIPPTFFIHAPPPSSRYSQRYSQQVGTRVRGTGSVRRLARPGASATSAQQARTSLLDLDYSAKVYCTQYNSMVISHRSSAVVRQ